jgi:hypothetical protein
MKAGETHEASEFIRRLFTIRNGSLLFFAFCIGVTLVSVGITFVLAHVLGRELGTDMGQIGQIFESVNAAFSGLGFIALVVTFRLQYSELVLQRLELGNQREAMDRTQSALHRSAEADMRICHIELVRMSLEDQDLAEVWPGFHNGQSAKTAKQHAYVDLIVRHHRMMHSTGFLDDDDVRGTFGYLLSSPVVRDYWKAGMAGRGIAPRSERSERPGQSERSEQTGLPGRSEQPERSAQSEQPVQSDQSELPGRTESAFNALVDRAYRETRPPDKPLSDGVGADVIDLGIRRQSDAM